MNRRAKNRGQSLLELGILFAIVVGALMAMKTFVQRGLHQKIRTASERQFTDPGTGLSFGGVGQFDPNDTGATAVTTTARTNEGGTVTDVLVDVGSGSDVDARAGVSENVLAVGEDGVVVP